VPEVNRLEVRVVLRHFSAFDCANGLDVMSLRPLTEKLLFASTRCFAALFVWCAQRLSMHFTSCVNEAYARLTANMRSQRKLIAQTHSTLPNRGYLTFIGCLLMKLVLKLHYLTSDALVFSRGLAKF
jgi:hypothetical protein